jgi:hypothetical protein
MDRCPKCGRAENDYKSMFDKCENLEAENKALKVENERLKNEHMGMTHRVGVYEKRLEECRAENEQLKATMNILIKANNIRPNPVSVEELIDFIVKLDNDYAPTLAQALHDRIYKDKPKEEWNGGANKVSTEPKEYILDNERHKFYQLWHTYHAKLKIPYSHDEKEKFFNSVAEIFLEDKPKEYCTCPESKIEYEDGERLPCQVCGKWQKINWDNEWEKAKPIKTEKIEQFDKNVDNGLWHTRVEDKLNEVIDRFNERIL